jgi:TolB protein
MKRLHCLITFAAPLLAASAPAAPLGQFEGPTDIGTVTKATIASYDSAAGTYTISASGDNMWAQRDAFGFVWTQLTGDIALAADIAFVGTSAQGHRKACLMFRQTLAPDSAYADVAVHGDGLTSLQFRSETGGFTREVQCPISAPRRVRLEKRGAYILLQTAGADGVLTPTGCTVRLPFEGPFYVGLAVCAHDNAAFETAVFSRVELGASPPSTTTTARTFALETIPLSSLDRRVVYRTTERIESAHFSRDGAALFFNANGRLHRLQLPGTEPPVVIDTGFAIKLNNDHGVSPDGTQLVIGDLTETGKALMYLLPIAGGTPQRIAVAAPAYWHGWSPDGLTLAYCAERAGNYDIYAIPFAGGAETRLTDAPGTDNGPDYSADGQWIYFHSPRSGRVQIWRMRADGSNQEQVTHDDFFNWFPHPSPNGQSIAFLSSKVVPDTGHPPDGDYFLRLIPTAGGEPREIARFYGGNGTLNVPSWSPDSARIAYITQEPPR